VSIFLQTNGSKTLFPHYNSPDVALKVFQFSRIHVDGQSESTDCGRLSLMKSC